MNLTLEIIRGRSDEVGACWFWKQGTTNAQCPCARDGKKSVIVRRRVVELQTGRPIRKGVFVVSKCEQSLCVSPECAVEMTGRQYIAWRNRNGTLNGPAHTAGKTAAQRLRSTLTMEKAQDIRARIQAGEDRGAVAALHGVTRAHANRVARGVNWAPPRGTSVFNGALA